MAKRKFNYIDGIVILIVIAIMVGAYWFFIKDGGEVKIASNKVDITFIAEADLISNEALQQLKIGDPLVSSGVFQDATITDIVIQPSSTVEAVNGELILLESPTTSRILVTISGEANKYGPYIDLGGQELKVGSKYYIKTDIFEAFGQIIEVVNIKN